jgi:hypothetical protein
MVFVKLVHMRRTSGTVDMRDDLVDERDGDDRGAVEQNRGRDDSGQGLF